MYLNFGQALNALKQGGKVRRRLWDEEIYWRLDPSNEMILVKFPSTTYANRTYSVDLQDIMAEDWHQLS